MYKKQVKTKTFENEFNSTLEKLRKIPEGEKHDEVSIPVYLHKNYFVRKTFVDRLKTAYKLTSFNGKSVMDYGCGSGIFLQSISNEIKFGIGVDLDIEIAKKIIDSDNLSLFQIKKEEDITKFSDIDIVTSFDVLEHVIELENLVKIFKKIISPGGILLISGPTENFPYKIARKIANIGVRGNLKGEEEHVRNIFDIKKKILEVGFILQKDVNILGLFHIISFKKEN